MGGMSGRDKTAWWAFAAAVVGVAAAMVAGARGPGGELPAPPARPERIVCLTPSVTEAVFALGAGDRVVGVTDFCTEPAAEGKVRLGGIFNPNFERLVSLRPDLVIVQGRAAQVAPFCRELRIPMVTVENHDVAGVLGDLRMLGEVLDCREEATTLCGGIEAQLAAVRRAVKDRPKRRVFLSLYRTGGSLTSLTTATDGTYLGELIRLGGGENVFGDLRQDYPQVSKEALLRRGVEVIIEPTGSGATSAEEEAQRRTDWRRLGPGSAVPAVETGRIYFPRADILLKPGPRLGEAARAMGELIHPEAFDEP